VSTPPKDETAPDQVAAPTVSTAPSGGAAEARHTSWWHWDALPHHLGRARTSTVILAVLFLAVFTLYLYVRPDVTPTDTTPAGGSSDVQVPDNPLVPTAPTTTPEPTEEPAPTTEPEETETPSEDTGTPTTGSTTSPETGTTEPTTTPSTPTETSEPTSPTEGTTGPSTSSPSPTG
jgi:hypothetical protein